MPKKIELKIETPNPPERIMPPLETPQGFFGTHKAITVALIIFFVGIAAAGSYYYQSGKWDKSLTNQPVLQHKEKVSDPSTDMKTYSNDAYGFSFKYPYNMTVNTDSPSPRLQTGIEFSVCASGEKCSYTVDVRARNANETLIQAADKIYAANKPSAASEYTLKDMTSTSIKVDGQDAVELYIDHYSDVGSTIVTVVNKDYVYLISGGVEKGDLDTFLSNFKFPTTTTTTDASLKTYTGKNFALTMQYPAGYDVKEGPNYILVSPTPYKTDELGMDNAFFKLTKYDADHTKAGEIAAYKKNLKNSVESQVTIDSLTFTQLTGDDWGRFGGDSAGKVKVVFFNKSWLEIIQMPQGNQQTYDPIAVGTQILNSFKF